MVQQNMTAASDQSILLACGRCARAVRVRAKAMSGAREPPAAEHAPPADQQQPLASPHSGRGEGTFRHQKLPGRDPSVAPGIQQSFRFSARRRDSRRAHFATRNFPGGTPLWVLESNKLCCFPSGGVILTTPGMNLPDGGHTTTSRCKGTAKGGTHLLVAAGFLLRSSSNVAAI